MLYARKGWKERSFYDTELLTISIERCCIMNYDLVSIVCTIAVAAMVVLAFYFEFGGGVKKDKDNKDKDQQL